MADEKTHPLRIGDTYAGQFLRPEDGIREREEAERKAELQELAAEGTVPHEASEAYAEAWDEEIAKYATETTDESDGHPVDGLIVQAVADAGARVEAASLTPDERLASLVGKAVAQALNGGEPESESSIYDEAFGPEPDGHSALLQELEDPDLAEFDDEEEAEADGHGW